MVSGFRKSNHVVDPREPQDNSEPGSSGDNAETTDGEIDQKCIESLHISSPPTEKKKLLFKQCSLRGRDKCNIPLLESLLLEIGPNVQNELGETPLGVALKKLPKDINYEVFETIMKCGGDGMFQYKKDRGVLADVLFYFGDRRTITAYLPYHKQTDAVLNRRLETALHTLVFRQETRLVKEILKMKASPDKRDIEGKTPLHLAVAQGSPKIAEYLIKFGADVNAQCNEGSTPLHYACGRIDKGCIDVLLRNNCDVNIQDEKGHTPLFYIIKHPCNKDNVLRKLLNAGCRIEDSAKEFKPLHELATESIFGDNAAKYAKILISRGFDVNERDSKECTALHQAARFGTETFIVCLFENGADVNMLNSMAQTPLDIALRYRQYPHVVEIMKNIALNKFTNGNVHKELIEQIELSVHLIFLHAKLLTELHILSAEKNPVSYLDIYFADRSTLEEYTKNQKIVRHVRDLEPSVFPFYGRYIRQKFDAVLERREAVEFGIQYLVESFRNRLPYLCVINIIQCLSTEDIWVWRDLIES